MVFVPEAIRKAAKAHHINTFDRDQQPGMVAAFCAPTGSLIILWAALRHVWAGSGLSSGQVVFLAPQKWQAVALVFIEASKGSTLDAMGSNLRSWSVLKSAATCAADRVWVATRNSNMLKNQVKKRSADGV